jgi:predicted ATPase
MLVTFKNTGLIKEADIRLDGLTVIAGENDTGKSTIGKLLFCIIKTFNRAEEYGKSYIERKIKNLIEDYYLTLRKKADNESVSHVAKEGFNEIEKHAIKLLNVNNNEKEEIEESKSKIAEKALSLMTTIKHIANIGINLEDLPAQIFDILESKQEREDIYKKSFQSFLISVFGDNIANKYDRRQKYLITGEEGKNPIFEIVGSDRTVDLRLKDKLNFQDATFIDSPILLNLSDTVSISKTAVEEGEDSKKKIALLKKPYIPEYMKDFILKLKARELETVHSKIIGDIQDIMNGSFYYDRIENDFIFERDNKTYKGLSIASGILPLGIISILYQTGFLNKKNLLIWDEPENHLHPQWLIQLAEVLVKLVKKGIPMLLISHSPYLIEAVKTYSDKFLEKVNTAFYLSEKKKNTFVSGISDVTHDLSPIYNILAEPYRKLDRFKARNIFG